MNEKLRAVPPEYIERELWTRACLDYMLFPGGQSQIIQSIIDWHAANPHDAGPFCVEAHRSAGKSYGLLTLAIQWCLEQPGTQVRYGGPTYKQTLELTEHNLGKIEQRAPRGILELRNDEIVVRNPAWKGGKYDKSTIRFFGVNRGTVESQRGKRANKIILDEVGFMEDTDYVIYDVLTPLFMLQENPLMVISSTPPRSTAHKWCGRYVPEAIRSKRYFLITADDNPDFREADRKVALAAYDGDENCVAWKRDYLCKHISDPTAMVVPEFTEERKKEVVVDHPKPEYCYQLVGFDSGFKDASAVLFTFVDWDAQKWVIDDEIVTHYTPTSVLAKMIKEKAVSLLDFVGPPEDRRPAPLKEQTRWIADATPQQLADFAHDHQIYFSPAEKKDAYAQLSSFRSAMQQGKIRINPRCVNLIHQLEAGVWNATRKDFERVADAPLDGEMITGHLDAVKAAIYLWFKVKDVMRLNPWPDTHFSEADHRVPAQVMKKRQDKFVFTNNPINTRRIRL